MRVDAYNKVSQLYQTNSVKKSNEVSKTGKSDKLEISSLGKDYHVAKQAVQNVPDIRQDKVDEIKARLASGTYQVNAEEIADKLVDNYFDFFI